MIWVCSQDTPLWEMDVLTLVWISSILLLLLWRTQNVIVPDVNSPIIDRPTSLPLAKLGKKFTPPAPLRLNWELNAKWKTVETPGMVIFQRKLFFTKKNSLFFYEKMYTLLLDCTRVIGVRMSEDKERRKKEEWKVRSKQKAARGGNQCVKTTEWDVAEQGRGNEPQSPTLAHRL